MQQKKGDWISFNAQRAAAGAAGHAPLLRDFRSQSVDPSRGGMVVDSSSINSPEPVYLSMTRTKRVVVIPINGGASEKSNVVQIPLRESCVDQPEYVTTLEANSKVVSMGNKTCISVNESSLVSTKAIVHQQQQQQHLQP